MKLVDAYFSARKDLESSFQHCAGPVRHVDASFSARKDLEGSFHHSGGPVKFVHASFSASNDLESSFQCCVGPVSSCLPFQYLEISRKQFSPLGCPMKVVQAFLSAVQIGQR